MIKKDFLLGILLLVSSSLCAQTTVIEEKFKVNDFPIGYNFLPNANRIVIQKGNSVPQSSNFLLKNLYSYDYEGFREVLLENGYFMNCIFSPTENSFFVSEFSPTESFGEQYKLVVGKVASPLVKIDNSFQYFNDNYQFSIVNQKFNEKINFEKDSLYLNKITIETRENSKIKIKKPSVSRIVGDNFIKYPDDVIFSVRVNNDYFSVITKSINKDYKSSTLYRSTYNYDGEQLENLSYKVEIPKGFLIYSNNGGGYVNPNSEAGDTYISYFAINNFVVDIKTENLYVYGLFGEEAKSSSNITNKPMGFYVFKFDKSGKKIWESIQPINDKDEFNSNQNIANLRLNLSIRKKELLVYISSNSKKNGYLNYSLLDDETGKITKINKVMYETTEELKKPIGMKNFISNSTYKNFGLENKLVDIESLIAKEINLDYSKYITTLQNKTPLFIKTFYSKKGIWLLESDNSSYYKASFFQD